MKARRIMMSLMGVIICAISVGMFKTAALGVDPFQTFMAGVDKVIPISFGTLYVITNIVLLSFSLIVDRHNIGLASLTCSCWAILWTGRMPSSRACSRILP